MNELPQITDSSLQLVVTKNSIMLDDKELIRFTQGGRIPTAELHTDGVTVKKLYYALEARSLELALRHLGADSFALPTP